MAIPQNQLDEIRQELITCSRPVFFFHDDPDGLCSFLLLYKFVKSGKGVIVKTVPRLTKDIFAGKVEEYGADKVFILDVAEADDDFIEAVKVPIVWIDHHAPVNKPGVKYFNPRVEKPDEYSPVSYWCYKALENDLKNDMWLSAVGSISDAYYPAFMDEFRKKYPDLLKSKTKNCMKIVYETKLGDLIKIFSFALKGRTKEVMTCVKVLTRIENPYELVDQTSSQGRFVYKQFAKIYSEYERLIEQAKKIEPDKGVVCFTYTGPISLTKDIANELTYHHPKKLIAVGREKFDEVKFSLRWHKNVRKALNEALTQIEGYGGGHEKACGAVIKLKDIEKFIEILKQKAGKA
jgi:single-stranded DNA-specific DHH superfamily exonuclease